MATGVFAVICAAAVLLAGIKIYNYVKSMPTDEQIILAENNAQNGGMIATDGTWLYYDDSGLCKIRLKDGQGQTVISSEISAQSMFYLGNSLFYYSFFGYHKLESTNSESEDLERSQRIVCSLMESIIM